MTRQDRHNVRAMRRVLRREGASVPQRGCLGMVLTAFWAFVATYAFVIIVALMADVLR